MVNDGPKLRSGQNWNLTVIQQKQQKTGMLADFEIEKNHLGGQMSYRISKKYIFLNKFLKNGVITVIQKNPVTQRLPLKRPQILVIILILISEWVLWRSTWEFGHILTPTCIVG